MATQTTVLTILFLGSASLLGGCEKGVPASEAAKGQVAESAPAAHRNGDPPASVREGGEILLRSRRAYDALHSYAGTIELVSTATYANGPFSETRRLDVSFQRPAKLRLEGDDSNGAPYSIVTDGRTTTVSAPSLGLSGERRSAEDALVEFGGISLGGTTLLPGILLGTKWQRENLLLPSGESLSALAAGAKLDGTEAVGGHECYRIVCPGEIETRTVYVDVDSFLIRRVDTDASQEQMLAQKRAGGGGRTGLILSTRSSQLWEERR